MSEEAPRKKEEEGGAGWIMTFADLMSLLMCFFVLLLSFAELDVMKFKAIAGSLKLAFGVQREVKAIEVPMGTSIVAQEFSPGKPEPSIIDEVRQQTQDEEKQTLEFTDALVEETEGRDPEDSDGGEPETSPQTEQDARQLAEALREEIEQGMIQIETQGKSIVIRIREKGSFPSGTARFDPAFTPVVAKLRESLQDVDGKIAVAGHTDNIPIKTAIYRSNWDLSSARAVSVVHALLDDSPLDAERFVVEGHGDAHPLVPNDSPANRAQNRRVEITIRQDEPDAAPVRETLAIYAPAGGADAVPAPGDTSGDVQDAIDEALPAAEEPAAAEAQPDDATPSVEPAAAADDDALPDWVPRAPSLSAPPAPAAPGANAAPPPGEAPARPKSRLDNIRDGFNG